MSTNNFPNTLEVDIIFVSDIHDSFPDKKIEETLLIMELNYTYRNERVAEKLRDLKHLCYK